jgi:hypothetical protein
MAAPSATARQDPAGIKLKDGHRSFITFARFPAVKFWEKTVEPFGLDGGEAVDQTTMHNDDWVTKAPQQLKDTTNSSGTAAYDPAVLDQIGQMINEPDTITYTFLDGSTWAIYGYLKSFTPSALTRGQQPEANFEIVHTNIDHANDDVETGAVAVSVAGS